MLKFDLSQKFGIIDDINIGSSGVTILNHNEATNLRNNLGSVTGANNQNILNGNTGGGGSGHHEPNEECNGMLRIWDGPLREVPICNDLNWYDFTEN